MSFSPREDKDGTGIISRLVYRLSFGFDNDPLTWIKGSKLKHIYIYIHDVCQMGETEMGMMYPTSDLG